MNKNKILDYDQVKNILHQMVQNGKIIEKDDLGKTEHGLKIRHYTIGEGKLDIVITAATHGSEIITTDFVIRLMEEINVNKEEWNNILKNFTIHFIPMLNPEGYLISTSAIRKLIPRDMQSDEAEKICKQYYMAYKEDDIKEIDKVKRHQAMFEGIDATCIPEKYASIRKSVEEILKKYTDLPKWCLHTWSANANGIDIQANSIYNPKNRQITENKVIYISSLRYNNIDISHPGPINCPFDKEKGFKIERETEAISKLLENLNEKGTLFTFLNYHSTGGLIFQRPASLPENLKILENDRSKKEIINYLFAKLYSDKTYKNTGIDSDGKDKREVSKYTIKTQSAPATSSNDIFRIMYPKNMLIELSSMGGNPIGPYGDLKGNYTNTINSNLNAVKYTLKVANIAQMIAEASYKRIKQLKGNNDYDKVIQLEDIIYQEFSERIKQLEKIEEDKYNKNKKYKGYDRDE